MKSIRYFYRVIWLYLLSIVLLLSRSLPALTQNISFTKITPPKESPFAFITGITQDTFGYMWFTSGKVLYRYNGYEFATYKNDSLDSNSLGGKRLMYVFADKSGFIWVSDFGHGLDRLDPQTGIFTHYRHNEADVTSISTDTVFRIIEDHEGYLWIGTMRGLNRLDKKTGKFIRYKHDPDDQASLSDDRVRDVYEDRSGIIWVATGSVWVNDNPSKKGGLNRLDRKTGKFVHYLHDPNDPHSLIDNRVTAIYEDRSGIFWVGTAGDGLHIMDRATGKFERQLYDPVHPERLSRPPQKKIIYDADDHITFIKEDGTGAIWIGTFEGGLNRYDPKTRIVSHYEVKSDRDSLHEIGAWQMYSSREGVIWISAWQVGLYKIDPFRWDFPHYPSPGNIIESFYEEPDGILWIGTEEGLFRKDLNTGKVKRYIHDPLNAASLGNNYIQFILKDHQGNIWLGTHGGLDLLNKDNETFTHYRHDPENSDSLSSNHLGLIYEDPQARLWLCTASGLNLMDRKMGTFTRYFFDSKEALSPKNNISYVLIDRQRKLWTGSWAGLNLLNEQNGKFKVYLESKSIYSICEDAQGDLWVGTNDGLYLYNRASDLFTRFVDHNSHAEITEAISIVEDNQRNLWICFTHGLIKLNAQRNVTYTYGSDYGVDNLILTYCHKGPQGRLYFSDLAGYFAFFPDQLNKNIRSPEILLTTFRIGDHVVNSGEKSPLQEPLSRAKEIRLHYNQNVFSFDFVAIDYSTPQSNRHLYMLENYDNIWRQAGSELRAYYFNIPPGKYIFRVKAANSSGISAEKSIKIVITPPWWRTWWFYALCILAVTTSVYTLFRYRLSQKLKAFELRDTISRDLHDEVGSTLSSIGFLSSMALEDVDTNKEKTHNTLSSINESAHKMLDAMNDIIWNIQPQNDTLDNIVVRMRSFASELLEAKKINLCFNIADNVKHLHLALAVRHDFLLIYKEAVNNLAKYSAASEAKINLEFHHPYLNLTISDNGKGFDQQKIKNGNGLKNMRSRAKKIGAEYHFQSVIGKGTTITLKVKPT